MRTLRISHLAGGIFLASSLCLTLTQAQTAPPPQQAPSVAEAARKAREQSRTRPQAAKVFTNEDIADLKGVVNVVGPPPAEPPAAPATGAAPADGAAAPAAAEGAPAAAAQAAAPPEVKDETYWRTQFAAARKKLADDTKELDILQREYNLKQQQFYMDPNVALREQNNRADLNKTLEQINAKKLDVEADQQAISALEDQLRQAGGNPGWSRPVEPVPAP
jgi:hypothetical protein